VTIEQALYTYLMSKSTVTDLVGSCVYLGRRPRHAGTKSITLTPLGGEGVYYLSDETEVAQKVVDLSVYTEGHTASQDCETVYEAVRILISGFRGTMSTLFVHGLTLEAGSGAIFPESPDPVKSDYWVWRKLMNLSVTYGQAATTWSS
jgi:hypothetical protein